MKMELVPSTEEVMYYKFGMFGNPQAHRVRISQLERVDFDEEKYRMISVSFRSVIDRNMLFRVKDTDELLLFDLEGLWHEEGITHDLIN